LGNFFHWFFIFLWNYKPALYKKSGEKAVWIRYDDKPKEWRFYALLLTACIFIVSVIMIVIDYL